MRWQKSRRLLTTYLPRLASRPPFKNNNRFLVSRIYCKRLFIMMWHDSRVLCCIVDGRLWNDTCRSLAGCSTRHLHTTLVQQVTARFCKGNAEKGPPHNSVTFHHNLEWWLHKNGLKLDDLITIISTSSCYLFRNSTSSRLTCNILMYGVRVPFWAVACIFSGFVFVWTMLLHDIVPSQARLRRRARWVAVCARRTSATPAVARRLKLKPHCSSGRLISHRAHTACRFYFAWFAVFIRRLSSWLVVEDCESLLTFSGARCRTFYRLLLEFLFRF